MHDVTLVILNSLRIKCHIRRSLILVYLTLDLATVKKIKTFISLSCRKAHVFENKPRSRYTQFVEFQTGAARSEGVTNKDHVLKLYLFTLETWR